MGAITDDRAAADGMATTTDAEPEADDRAARERARREEA
eukprot:CAMPEP_0179873114 /NCGR_PEP_ID=MMETSP0982-20121206/21932_1 /TAXON_ID=483367 /ORGANISM="non described non described, Strain CCMP 2436" /LENGTH=38 /DNA_ID= /DNA_START= /DNA_END= /DNA_ORIENTATION=